MKKSLSFFFLFLVLVTVLVPCVLTAAESVTETVPGSDVVGALLGNLPASWGEWVTLVVTVCAAVAVVLPAPKDNANVVWRGIYWLVQVLALNKGRAANAQDAQPTVVRRVG